MSDLSEKIRTAIKLYAAYAVILIMCVMYTLIGTVQIEKKDADLMVLTEGMLLPYVFGVALTTLFREQGLIIGAQEPRVKRAEEEHEAAAGQCAPRVEELSHWCEDQTRKQLRLERMRILADAGLRYEDYYDEAGELTAVYEPREIPGKTAGARRLRRMERRKLRAYDRAVRFRISPLYAGELIDEGHRAGDPFYMGRSQKAFRAQSFGSSLVTKPVISFVVGYYGFQQIENFKPAVLIGQLFGLSIFLTFGVIAMMSAMSYKKEEYCGRLTRKTGYLRQFYNDVGGVSNGNECKAEND